MLNILVLSHGAWSNSEQFLGRLQGRTGQGPVQRGRCPVRVPPTKGAPQRAGPRERTGVRTADEKGQEHVTGGGQPTERHRVADLRGALDEQVIAEVCDGSPSVVDGDHPRGSDPARDPVGPCRCVSFPRQSG